MSLLTRIDDGFSTTLEFALNPVLEFYEVEVQPPGWDGGPPIPTTTMRNDELETFFPQTLITLTPVTFTGAYTADAFHLSTGIAPMINVNQLITLTLPNSAEYTFYGYLQSWIPPSHVKGVRPLAAMHVQPTNTNASKVETLPLYVPAA